MSGSEYERVRRRYGGGGGGGECVLWEDPEFPATQASVFYHQTPPFTFTWRRPRELSARPYFVQESNSGAGGPTSSGGVGADVQCGKMGDRWLVSCLCVLHACKGLFYRVVPADQDFERQYCGAFRFRLWWCGEWTEVVVDDRLPTVNGRLAFLQAARGDQYWAPLLEKAYAKLHGSYEALKYGTLLDGLADMTGGVAECVPAPSTAQCARVLRSLCAAATVVTCVARNGGGDSGDRLPDAPQSRHANNYRVLGVDTIESGGGDDDTKEVLVRLFDPQNGGGGLPSDSPQPPQHELALSPSEWSRSFTHLELVHLDLETARDEPSLKQARRWHARLYHGRWQRGVSAGGCRNNTDTFHINPQLLVQLQQQTDGTVAGAGCGDDDTTVIVSLNQHSIMEPKVIGFTAYRLSDATGGEQLGKQWFKKNKSLVNSQYTNSRQVTHRCQLSPGHHYLLLPTTFEPGQECGFTLRVLSARPVKLRALDTAPRQLRDGLARAPELADGSPLAAQQQSSGGTATVVVGSTAAGAAPPGFAQYEAVFLQLADEHRTVNAFELQELLDACLPNDYIKSCASADVCRQAVLTLGGGGTSGAAARSGRLSLRRFRDLMCSLKAWQGVFKQHTREKTGILKAERLRDALLDVGYQLDTDTLATLITRYMRKDGTLRFGDFVAIVLHLAQAFAAFNRRDPQRTGTVKLTLADWLNTSLTC